jgi:hypothetical protein
MRCRNRRLHDDGGRAWTASRPLLDHELPDEHRERIDAAERAIAALFVKDAEVIEHLEPAPDETPHG